MSLEVVKHTVREKGKMCVPGPTVRLLERDVSVIF